MSKPRSYFQYDEIKKEEVELDIPDEKSPLLNSDNSNTNNLSVPLLSNDSKPADEKLELKKDLLPAIKSQLSDEEELRKCIKILNSAFKKSEVISWSVRFIMLGSLSYLLYFLIRLPLNAMQNRNRIADEFAKTQYTFMGNQFNCNALMNVAECGRYGDNYQNATNCYDLSNQFCNNILSDSLDVGLGFADGLIAMIIFAELINVLLSEISKTISRPRNLFFPLRQKISDEDKTYLNAMAAIHGVTIVENNIEQTLKNFEAAYIQKCSNYSREIAFLSARQNRLGDKSSASRSFQNHKYYDSNLSKLIFKFMAESTPVYMNTNNLADRLNPSTQEKINEDDLFVSRNGQCFSLTSLIDYHNARDYRGHLLGEQNGSKFLLNPLTNDLFNSDDAESIMRMAIKKDIQIRELRNATLPAGYINTGLSGQKSQADVYTILTAGHSASRNISLRRG